MSNQSLLNSIGDNNNNNNNNNTVIPMNMLPTSTIIYDDSIDTSAIQNVLLIDSSVTDFQKYANANTFAIVYNRMCTRDQLLEVLTNKFPKIVRIAVVCHFSESPIFLNSESLFLESNTTFIIDVVKQFHISNIDFLACNTLQSQDWNNFYSLIQSETEVKVGASNDNTGNIKYGGDWIMESIQEDVQTVYFNDKVQNYSSLLTEYLDTSGNVIYFTVDGSGNASVAANQYKYLGSIDIPLKVKYNNIEYNVTSIGTQAFYICINLTSITIPNSVTSIGDQAFFDCRSLTSITIPSGVISIGLNAFSYCRGLTIISIQNGVTIIGDYAFSNCSKITSISIPSSVTSIGLDAFEDCTGLTSITVDPNNQKYSSDSNGVLFDKLKTNLIRYPVGNTITSYTIPNSVTSIGDQAFEGCTNLTSIYLQNNVISIGLQAFYNCTNLTSISIPNSVTSIGDQAFLSCSGLKSITIPSGVISIGDNAFQSCTGLTSITIPISVTSIGEYAFYNCTNLTSIYLQDNVISIGLQAFYGCNKLTSVNIGDQRKILSLGDTIFPISFSNLSSTAKVTFYNMSTSSYSNLTANGKTIANYFNNMNQIFTSSSMNTPPLIRQLIPDQIWVTNKLFSYTFPVNTFIDTSGDTLTYTINSNDFMTNGWNNLQINSGTRTISGTPTIIGNYIVKITATDNNSLYISSNNNLSTTISFNIIIIQSSHINPFIKTTTIPSPLLIGKPGKIVYTDMSANFSTDHTYKLYDLFSNNPTDMSYSITTTNTISFINVTINKNEYQILQIRDISNNNHIIDDIGVFCISENQYSDFVNRQQYQSPFTNTTTTITDCYNSTSTINTYPSPLIQTQPGILTYSNPSVFAAPNDSYVLKNVLGSTVSDTYVAPSTLMTVFVPSIDGPVDIGYDNSGVLYVGAAGNDTIYTVSPSGVITSFSVVLGYNFSTGIVFDSSNNLYVFRILGGIIPQIMQIDTSGNSSVYYTSGLLSINVYGLEIDNSDNIYVSNNTPYNNILKIPPGGGSASVYYTGTLNDPHGLVFDNSGNLYVADTGNNRIAKISPGGLSISTYATSPLFSGYIVGLVFDVNGNLYVTANITNKILKVYPNGSSTILFASSPLLNEPYGITIDTSGYLYIANSVGNNILKMTTVTTLDTFTFSNVIIKTSGLNHLYMYDITTGQLIASDICIEISAVCFREGTKILCFVDKKEKYVPIEDIKEDTFVKIYNKTGKFKDSYKRATTIVKSSIINSKEPSMHKLYKLSRSKNPALIADLYVTGSHALLYDNLSDEEFDKMECLINRYNNYNIKFSNEDEVDENYLIHVKNMIKYYNDYKFTIEDKYKLIAYFNLDFEEVNDNSVCNIYHIVLENENKYDNYGIYANGVLAESTCQVSLTRFPGFEKINEINKVNTGIKKGFDINDKLDKYLLKRSVAEGERLQDQDQDQDQDHNNKKMDILLNEKLDKIEDAIVKQINTTHTPKNYTYRRFNTKKNITYKSSYM